MKALVLGRGFIGARIAGAWPDVVVSAARIDDFAAVDAAIVEHAPDVVVNAAGKTGRPNVDWCEQHVAETMRANTLGAIVVAEACAKRGVYLLHLASGCVFYGPSPDPAGWGEDDFANPESTYSRSKYAADLVLSRMRGVGIARIRLAVDWIPHPRNLIDKLARYPRIIDVENSVTVLEDFLDAAYRLAEARGDGIFHLVNPGAMRHRDLVDLYREHVDPEHACEWIDDALLTELGLATRRRSNCLLRSTRLEALGIHMRPIAEALPDTMRRYAAARARAPIK